MPCDARKTLKLYSSPEEERGAKARRWRSHVLSSSADVRACGPRSIVRARATISKTLLYLWLQLQTTGLHITPLSLLHVVEQLDTPCSQGIGVL